MPPPVSGRSEVIRLSLTQEEWSYFEDYRDVLRRESPEAEVLPGDTGTRQVLRAWVEGMIQETVAEARKP